MSRKNLEILSSIQKRLKTKKQNGYVLAEIAAIEWAISFLDPIVRNQESIAFNQLNRAGIIFGRNFDTKK